MVPRTLSLPLYTHYLPPAVYAFYCLFTLQVPVNPEVQDMIPFQIPDFFKEVQHFLFCFLQTVFIFRLGNQQNEAHNKTGFQTPLKIQTHVA